VIIPDPDTIPAVGDIDHAARKTPVRLRMDDRDALLYTYVADTRR